MKKTLRIKLKEAFDAWEQFSNQAYENIEEKDQAGVDAVFAEDDRLALIVGEHFYDLTKDINESDTPKFIARGIRGEGMQRFIKMAFEKVGVEA